MSDLYPELVLKHAPWSVSKAGALEMCAKQFLHRYVEKRPQGPKDSKSRIGIVAHAIIEAGLRVPGTDLVSVLREQEEKERLTREELLTCAAKISPCQDFLARIKKFKADNGVIDEYIEHKLAISATHEAHTFDAVKNKETGEVISKPLLRGVLDHGMRTADDFFIVIDHKSGKKKPIAEHSAQFYAYMILALVNFPWLRGVQSGIHYIGEPKVDWFPRFDTKHGAWTREEIVRLVLPWLRQYLHKTVRKLGLVETGSVQGESGWQCLYCDFPPICEKGQAEIRKREEKTKAKGKADANV